MQGWLCNIQQLMSQIQLSMLKYFNNLRESKPDFIIKRFYEPRIAVTLDSKKFLTTYLLQDSTDDFNEM